MPMRGPSAIAILTLSAGIALAQDSVDPGMMEQGAALYAQHCQICHKPEGQGTASVFPPLAGSEKLADADYVVTNIHNGVVTMPPFPWLSDVEVAALANYVRNSFGNTYGGVTEAGVAATRAELEPVGQVRSIWDGVYTQEQADRGRAVFNSPCGLCHGSRLNGAPDDQDMRPAPPLARANFLRVWNGRSLGALLSYSRMTMPQSNPGFLPEEDYLAIIAHMLATTGVPPGTTPLSLDIQELGRIRIGPKP
jgi:mono/diheme cytochrome c family protein